MCWPAKFFKVCSAVESEKTHKYINTSGIDPRYDIYYFFDNIFILYLMLFPQMITPGLDLSTDARGTENCNSVPAGIGQNFKNCQKYLSILKDLSRLSL